MQKKYIALAVAALASGAAFAQTSVVFGGIVDMGYTYKSSNANSAVNSRSAVDQGGQDGSRLFWTATEDLGNGLSVSAKQEIRIAADVRGSVGIDSSVLTLAGKSWGAVRAGNYGSASDDIAGFSESGGMGFGNEVLPLIVVGTHYNVVGYVSPDMGGFQAKLNYSTNDTNGEDANGNGDLNIRAYSVNGAYTGIAGLKLGAAYQQQSKTLTVSKKTEWTLTGGYTMGQFSVGAGYDRTKDSAADPMVRKAWRLTAGMAITPSDQVALSYSRVKNDYTTATDLKANGYGVSYSHMMSKRTNVYATYGHISQSDSSALYSTTAAAADSTYKNQFRVGVRHQF